jgi:DNA ligase (NAD+)
MSKKKIDLAYERGEPLMSDMEYDKKFGINATGKILDEKTPWKKFKHTIPMASLKKIDVINEDNGPFFDNLFKFIKQNKLQSCNFVSSFKYDGMAIVLYYKEGKFINAVTRGDGKTGEDITRNVMQMKNFKSVIDDWQVTSLTSEALIPRDRYKKYLEKDYKNIRNAGAGIAKRFKGESQCHLMSLRYYGIETLSTDVKTEEDKFKLLKKLGFKNVAFEVLDGVDDIISFYHRKNKKKHLENFEADGIVITINEMSVQKALGRDPSGNPKYSIAMKYPYPMATTTLKSIEWSMGKVGTITPVAKVKAVDLGVTVENISLANLDTIKKLWPNREPMEGDVVEVFRSGDVIPQIRKVITRVKRGAIQMPPGKCPMCKGKTAVDGPFLVCTNLKCDSRKLGDLCKWTDKIKDHFKVKGIGPERIQQMFKANIISTVSDLYKLSVEDLIYTELEHDHIGLVGVKEKAALNILAFQEHDVIPLHIFLSALNIPNVGESIFQFIIDAGYDTLEKITSMSEEEICSVPGLGKVRALLIIDWLGKKRKVIDELLDYLTISKPVKKKLKSSNLKGKSFCFTGKLSNSRPHFENIVKENGGEIKGISASLNYLVAGEKAGSKLSKAEKLGVEVLTEEQFVKLLK